LLFVLLLLLLSSYYLLVERLSSFSSAVVDKNLAALDKAVAWGDKSQHKIFKPKCSFVFTTG
jgi:hypothetical protein